MKHENEILDLTNYPDLDKFLNKDNKYYILDDDKNVIPASLMEWASFFENTDDERIVKRTEINGFRVSTVFLGLDHGFNGLLDIFETMVFKGKDFANVEYCERHSTWKAAEKGHERAIEWVKNRLPEIEDE